MLYTKAAYWANCYLFLYRKLPFSPLLLFPYPTRQPAPQRTREGKPLSAACHLGAILHLRSIHLHVSSEQHNVYGLQTSVASRRGFFLMVESRSNAGVIISTVLENQIVQVRHLGSVNGW